MYRWSVSDIRELVQAIRSAGRDSFYTRRVVQRLDREELTIRQATALLRAACAAPATEVQMTPHRSPPVLRVFRGGGACHR